MVQPHEIVGMDHAAANRDMGWHTVLHPSPIKPYRLPLAEDHISTVTVRARALSITQQL